MTDASSNIPDVGIHQGIDFLTYARWDAINQSKLSGFKTSAKHARHAMLQPDEETDALLIGHATHAAILEPDSFESHYVAAPKVDRRTTAGKAEYAAFLAGLGDKIVLSADEYKTCLAMRDAVAGHSLAREILYTGQGKNELSMAWDDPATGIRCKGRIDRINTVMGFPAIIDLKTTRHVPTRRAVERSIIDFGYHLQAGFYTEGANILAPAEREFIFIFVESSAPHDVAVYRLLPEAIAQGRLEIQGYMQRYKHALETQSWPGVQPGLGEVGLPAWARNDNAEA